MTEEIEKSKDLAEVRDDELKEFHDELNIDTLPDIKIKLFHAGALNVPDDFMDLLQDLTVEMKLRGL